MTLTQLIEALQRKSEVLPPNIEIEYLVCTEDGMLIAVIVDKQGKAMQSALKLFNQ